MSEPFDPPASPVTAASGTGSAWVAWALAGAVCGTAIGFTLHVGGRVPGATGPIGAAGTLGGALLGALALRVDRAHAARIGEPIAGVPWPVHGAVHAIPRAMLVPGALWLGLLVSVAARSLVPMAAASAGALVAGTSLIRVWSAHRIVAAMQALSRGDDEGARTALATLAQHPFAHRAAREAARRNLAALALRRGDLGAAAHWYAQAGDDASVLAGLALARAGLGQIDAAARDLERARAAPGRVAARAEIDAVRVVLLWRTEGPAEAESLAERLDGPDAGSLLRALRARLRGAPDLGDLGTLVDALAPR